MLQRLRTPYRRTTGIGLGILTQRVADGGTAAAAAETTDSAEPTAERVSEAAGEVTRAVDDPLARVEELREGTGGDRARSRQLPAKTKSASESASVPTTTRRIARLIASLTPRSVPVSQWRTVSSIVPYSRTRSVRLPGSYGSALHQFPDRVARKAPCGRSVER